MKRKFFVTFFLLAAIPCFSQTDSTERLFAFRINEYMVPLNDSIMVVQVSVPDASPFKIKKDQLALLKYRYEDKNEYDTSMVGWGRCNLIKSNYYYFGIHHTKERLPKQGDLLYTNIKAPCVYDGLLFKTGSHAIRFLQVDENQFYYNIEMFTMTSQRESEIIEAMVEDIHYTGQAMLEQSPEQNLTIEGGIYDGKKLFAAMQEIKTSDIEKFLKYILARPLKYAGNSWKISEIFATWMASKSPIVKE